VELSLIFLLQCFFLLLQSPPSPLSLSVCAWGILTSHPILPKLQTGCQPCVFLVQFIQWYPQQPSLYSDERGGCPITCETGTEVMQRYIVHPYSTSVLQRGSHCHAPAALPPGNRYPAPIVQEAKWALGLIWMGPESYPYRGSTTDQLACSKSLNQLW
jgi:hypothetical protein